MKRGGRHEEDSDGQEEEDFENYDDIFEIIEPAKRERFIKNMEKFVTGLIAMGDEESEEEDDK